MLRTLCAVALILLLNACDSNSSSQISGQQALQQARDLLQNGSAADKVSAITRIEEIANSGNLEAQEEMFLLYASGDIAENERAKNYWAFRGAMNKSVKLSYQLSMHYSDIGDYKKAAMYLFLPATFGSGGKSESEQTSFDNANQALALSRNRGAEGSIIDDQEVAIDLAKACAESSYKNCDPNMDKISFNEIRYKPKQASALINPKDISVCFDGYCPCDGKSDLDRKICFKAMDGQDIDSELLRMASQLNKSSKSQ